MRRFVITLLSVSAVAGPAAAETRYMAYDASDRITQAMTRGITLEGDRGLFGAITVRRIISTSSRGSASIRIGGPDAARRALPEGATETILYTVSPEGDGRGLSRALCPGADEAFLILGRVRLGRPLTAQAIGRWTDGAYRHCVTLSYSWRGEWAVPPGAALDDSATPVGR
ncbi:hypothetical protein [Brevundimonas sp.]|uniref:hypothetical protein n=1 Tax=Brevundimonas sp. TaxID=1871086 RepID=UPI003F719EDE